MVDVLALQIDAVTADGMYLRINIPANERMGELIAYARTTGVVPPWSKRSP